MIVAGLCYFVVCLTLEQCQDYRRTTSTLLPELDVFYWTNAEEALAGPRDFSLSELMQSTSELQHWNFVSPEAQNWIPWYQYDPNNDQCTAYIKLDSGFVFSEAKEIDYPAMFLDMVENAHLAGASLINLEPECTLHTYYGLDSAAILLDLKQMREILTKFQAYNIDNAVEFYIGGDFASYLSAYILSNDFSLHFDDRTYCSDAVTVESVDPTSIPENAMFIRLQKPDTFGQVIKVSGLLGAAAGRATVF